MRRPAKRAIASENQAKPRRLVAQAKVGAAHVDFWHGGLIVMDVEYPVQLAYTREPVMVLAGTVSVIRPGRCDLALSDMEWQDLGLLELSELQEPPELSDETEGQA